LFGQRIHWRRSVTREYLNQPTNQPSHVSVEQLSLTQTQTYATHRCNMYVHMYVHSFQHTHRRHQLRHHVVSGLHPSARSQLVSRVRRSSSRPGSSGPESKQQQQLLLVARTDSSSSVRCSARSFWSFGRTDALDVAGHGKLTTRVVLFYWSLTPRHFQFACIRCDCVQTCGDR
jgi:hypothetical protein